MDTQWSQHLSKVVSLVFWLSMPFTSSLALWQSVLGLFMCLLLICPRGRSPPWVRDQAPSRAAPEPTCLTLGMVHVNPWGRKTLVMEWSSFSPVVWNVTLSVGLTQTPFSVPGLPPLPTLDSTCGTRNTATQLTLFCMFSYFDHLTGHVPCHMFPPEFLS